RAERVFHGRRTPNGTIVGVGHEQTQGVPAPLAGVSCRPRGACHLSAAAINNFSPTYESSFRQTGNGVSKSCLRAGTLARPRQPFRTHYNNLINPRPEMRDDDRPAPATRSHVCCLSLTGCAPDHGSQPEFLLIKQSACSYG